MNRFRLVLIAGLLMPAVALPAQWRAKSPEKKPVAQKTSAQNSSQETLLELLDQLEFLQNEVRELRNQTEVQGNDLMRLRSRMQDLTRDLDRRLRSLERQGGGASQTPPPKVSSSRSKTNRGAPATAAQQQAYEAAFQRMKRGDYTGAAQAFRKFMAQFPQSPLAANAQHWIAESNYFVRNFRLALKEYKKVIREYPNSRKIPEAMLKTGYTYYELGEWKLARKYLSEVVARYPKTRHARSAKARLKTMKKEGH